MKIRGLTIRVISAVLAASILFSVGYFGGVWGLVTISTLAIALGIAEYTKMAFTRFETGRRFSWLFGLIAVAFCLTAIQWPGFGLVFFAIANCAFFTGALWVSRNRIANEKLLSAMAMGSFGIVTCVCLPLFAIKLAHLPHGPVWFLFLMLVVFAGDTFAFFGGHLFGRHKLMANVSPNKTVEGSIAGLIGSALVGTLLIAYAFPEIAVWKVLLFCVLCGFAAQAGDLLMSLVKRVAQVKDSGTIMPGHGGVLDRLDGIYIAAPLVYAFAIW